MKPILALIGNAPLQKDFSSTIDSFDLVIRCNEAKTLGTNTGHKTNILCISNIGAPSKRIIAEKSVTKLLKFPELSEIWFPRNAESNIDNSKIIIEVNKLFDVRIKYFSKEMNERVFKKLAVFSDFDFVEPSTGILALCYILEQPEFDKYEKYLFGFTFEMWEGHPAKAERLLIKSFCENRNDLIFVPVSSYWNLKRIIKESTLFCILSRLKERCKRRIIKELKSHLFLKRVK
ncbi:MAG: glycosyltransferase family 29 protein [Saprospiraceae bacterium]|nr:glycosyltransferase family 29 protein [Saprospiraceae bacterium]